MLKETGIRLFANVKCKLYNVYCLNLTTNVLCYCYWLECWYDIYGEYVIAILTTLLTELQHCPCPVA